MYVFETRVGYYPDQVWDSDAFTFEIFDTTSHVPDYGATIPRDFVLYPAYPNPFNPSTTLSFSMPVDANVSLKIYDVMGRHVATLINGWRDVGTYHPQFDASDLTSGVYFYRLETQKFTQTKKMVLLK
jgi:hypothetical protein